MNAMTIRFCLLLANKIARKQERKKATQTIEHHHNRRSIFVSKFTAIFGRHAKLSRKTHQNSEDKRRKNDSSQVMRKVNNISIHQMATAQTEGKRRRRRSRRRRKEWREPRTFLLLVFSCKCF